MALIRQRAHERKMQQLALENQDLAKDVDNLETALALHTCQKSQSDLTTKETSIWLHGGEGKLSTYKSSKDLVSKRKQQSVDVSSVRSRPISAPVKMQEKPFFPSVVTNISSSKPGSAGNSTTEAKTSQGSVSHASSRATSRKKYEQRKTRTESEDIRVTSAQAKTLPPRNNADARVKKPRNTSRVDGDTAGVNHKTNKDKIEILTAVVDNLKKSWNLGDDGYTPVSGKVSTSQKSTKLANASVPRKQNTSDIVHWMQSLKLNEPKKYIDIFKQNKIDMECLKTLTERDLNSMGITAAGPVAKILRGIKALQHTAATSSNTLPPKTEGNSPEKQPGSVVESRPLSDVETVLGVSKVGVSSFAKPTIASAQKLSEKKATSACSVTRAKNVASAVTPVSVNRPKLNHPLQPDSRVTVSSVKPVVKSTRTSRARALQENTLRTAVQDISPLSTDTEDVTDDADKRQETINHVTSNASAVQLHVNGSTLSAKEFEAVSKHSKTEDTPLQSIENEIQSLCGEISSPDAIEKINRLQQRLQSMQQQLVNRRESEPKTVTMQLESESQTVTGQIEAGTQVASNKRCPSDGSSNRQEAKSQPAAAAPHTDDKAAVASQKMSKVELLREVRKQKEQHRREIRHLESELSRLKHKDPLRNCEIAEQDIYFLTQDLIGGGAFSQVFRGFYQGSEVAVKQLKVPLPAQDRNYFMAEVNLLKDLRHPRVVLLVGVCTSGKLPIMILEYMANGSLYDYLHNARNPSLDHAAYYQVARDVALGMNYLHKHRPVVLHLDMKSMNVLLTSHLRAKIADFGFSKLKHDANVVAKEKGKSKTSVKGTPAWLAPELLDNRDISTKCDVYSFGVILNEMLTREHPYPGCSVYQIIERVRRNKRPELPATCPQPLAALIESCWHKNPARRPAFKDILTRLDKLHFPPEWQSLFAQAGVPSAALDDPMTSRSLIDIVTRTLDGRMPRPSDVPALLLDSARDEHRNDVIELTVENMEDEDVVNDMSSDEEEFNAQLQACLHPQLTSGSSEKATPTGAINQSHCDSAVITSSAASTATECADVCASTEEGLERLRKSIEEMSLSITADSLDFTAPPLAPPPPPLLSADLSKPLQHSYVECDPVMSHDVSKRTPVVIAGIANTDDHAENTRHTVNPLRSSQLVVQRQQLRSAIEPHPHEQQTLSAMANQRTGERSRIRASMLTSQRQKLLSTDQPHPSQLRDLALVQPDQIDNLAALLKKAVDARRLAMDNTSTLDSVEMTDWSIE